MIKSPHRYRSHDTVPGKMKEDIAAALAETGKRNFPAAITIYKKMLSDHPDDAVVRNNLGCCLAELERFDDAEVEFVKALTITKSNRDRGIFIPRPYPKDPLRNLIRLYHSVYIKKTRPGARPIPRRRGASSPRNWKNIVRKLMPIVNQEGPFAALRKSVAHIRSKLNPLSRWQERVIELRAEEYDRENNINTAGALFQKDLGVINENQLYANYYRGTDALFFNNALASLKIDFKDYTFVDYGSGKGKALFLASAFSFKKIIGIEFSKDLDTVAQENIRRFKKDAIRSFCMDAVEYQIPNESLACYFYDPFNEPIMEKVIGNLRRAYYSFKKNIIIIYNNSRLYYLFDAENWLERKHSFGSIIIWEAKRLPPREISHIAKNLQKL